MSAAHCKVSNRFPARNTVVDGQWRRVRTVTCDRCGYSAQLTEKPGATLPDVMLVKKFVQRGWRLSGASLCPRCLAGKAPMSPAARRAAFCAINHVPRSNPKVPPMAETMAKPPPVSTPVDRRRIREALDTHYDEDAGRYRQSFSDDAVAAKLNVPVKWVADLRVANGYGPDVNEAAHLRQADIETLKAEVGALQTELLTRFDALEARLRKLLPGEGL